MNLDRAWKWSCKKVVENGMTDCKWTEDINNWHGPILYMCPENTVCPLITLNS